MGENARDAADTLEAVLKDDKEAPVRRSAAEALGRLGPGVKSAIPCARRGRQGQGRRRARQAAAAALASHGPNAVPSLLGLLKDKDAAVRSTAAANLAFLTDAAKDVVPPLINSLKDKEAEVRAAAAAALGTYGPDAKEAVKPLIGLAKDDDADVLRRSRRRCWAASAATPRTRSPW